MKAVFENVALIKNEDKRRFQIEFNRNYVCANYDEFNNQISLIHTKTESELKLLLTSMNNNYENIENFNFLSSMIGSVSPTFSQNLKTKK